ncbi:MAG: 16S rRNA processing protein RimM [Deltaproteobacteria bacterium]|nr:16S rRNA processing protein RimM [Deltaproteobacteria bacterium]
MTEGFIEVGRVVAAHGVSGRIKVTAYSGDPAGLLRARSLRLCGETAERREYEVSTAQRAGGCAVFALKGLSTAEEAKGWAGARVFVPRQELPPPEEDEYFHADLVGCAVVDEEGAPVGWVAEVVSGPAHDWLAIRLGGEEAHLPFVAAFIREVDIERRRIVVSPPGGWLDAR